MKKLNKYPFLSFTPSVLPNTFTTGNNEAANIVLGSPQTVSQTIHEFLCEELLRYFFVGGAMAEQFVGQEMALSQKEDLYYWSRREKSSSAEVDYVVVIDGRIHPVEVKKRSFRPVEKSASLPGKV